MAALGVIPACGGSKGVRRKNIRLLGGRPLMAHTIDAARESSLLNRFVVSTEDSEIAEIALGMGVEVIERPVALAEDSTPMVPVVQHALAAAEMSGNERFGCVVTLQVTTPFRQARDIDTAIELLRSSGADSVLGVVRLFDAHPVRAKRLVGGRLRDYCLPENEASRRQDLEPAYLRNGAIYVTCRDVVEHGSLRGADQCAYEMPPERSINIDEPLDWLVAETLWTLRDREEVESG